MGSACDKLICDPENGNESPRRRLAMNALALMLKPIDHGWAVTLTDGREVTRFTGLCAKRRAMRYLRELFGGDATAGANA
jgi:hypothetical protein